MGRDNSQPSARFPTALGRDGSPSRPFADSHPHLAIPNGGLGEPRPTDPKTKRAAEAALIIYSPCPRVTVSTCPLEVSARRSLRVEGVFRIRTRNEIGEEIGDFLSVERIDQAGGHGAIGVTIDA